MLSPAGLISDKTSAFHFVNDSAIESSIGIHTRTSWIRVGIPTITASTALSPDDNLWDPPRPRVAGCFARDFAAGEATCVLIAPYCWA